MISLIKSTGMTAKGVVYLAPIRHQKYGGVWGTATEVDVVRGLAGRAKSGVPMQAIPAELIKIVVTSEQRPLGKRMEPAWIAIDPRATFSFRLSCTLPEFEDCQVQVDCQPSWVPTLAGGDRRCYCVRLTLVSREEGVPQDFAEWVILTDSADDRGRVTTSLPYCATGTRYPSLVVAGSAICLTHVARRVLAEKAESTPPRRHTARPKS